MIVYVIWIVHEGYSVSTTLCLAALAMNFGGAFPVRDGQLILHEP